MCEHLVAHGPLGRLPAPRPCKRAAVEGSSYCARHGQIARRTPPADVRDGGFCVACAIPGRSYVLEGITIALCEAHGRALARAITEGR